MTVIGSTFTANQATGGNGHSAGQGVGGALNLESPCTTNIDNCTFTGNQANGGGGDLGSAHGGVIRNANWVPVAGYGSGAALAISNSTFTSNQANGGSAEGASWGGVIKNTNYDAGGSEAPLTISKSTFVGNQAKGGPGSNGGYVFGGVVSNQDMLGGPGAPLTISNCTFTGNAALGTAGGNGRSTPVGFAWGGVIQSTADATILGSTFNGNQAISGALAPGAATNTTPASVVRSRATLEACTWPIATSWAIKPSGARAPLVGPEVPLWVALSKLRARRRRRSLTACSPAMPPWVGPAVSMLQAAPPRGAALMSRIRRPSTSPAPSSITIRP
jgi:hypothetical protein